MSYIHVKTLVFLSLGVYCFMGIYTKSYPGQQMYPFFSWSLFSSIPNSVDRYTITFSRLGGKIYEPPLPFSESSFLFEELHQSPTQYLRYVQPLGKAIERGDTEEIQRQRALLERAFGPHAARYSVRHVRYDPVEFWKTDAYQSDIELAVFETEGL